jgi:quercetin dioxygenase-like cupin family protein
MNEEIKQIAHRLHGLREVMGVTIEEMAKVCRCDVNEYQELEDGNHDISVCTLQRVSHAFDIPLDTLMFGEEPKMKAYYLTRAGKGMSIERQKAYKYQALASGFKNRKMDPYIVTVEPKASTEVSLNTHEGQEFNMVLSGRLELTINQKVLVLNPGDSLYFNGNLPHGMRALEEKPVQFLAMII